MDLHVFDREALPYALRALRSVAEANGAFTESEHDFLVAVSQMHDGGIELDALPIADEHEVALHVRDEHARKRLVQLALCIALVEGDPPDSTKRAVEELARALAVDEAGVRVLGEVASGYLTIARIDFAQRARRFLLRGNDGLAVLKAAASAVIGLENAELAAKYRALRNYPEGSLGRAFYHHLDDHGFAFPGEKHGLPEFGLFHDVGHVLSGLGVDAQSEIQQAAFQAGFVRNDGFLFLLFGILQFHIGVRLTPIAPAEKGLFDVKKVMRAVERGAACKVDLTDGFDFWAHAEVPLEELRRRWEIPPA